MFAWPATWSRMIRARASDVCELCGSGRLYGYEMSYPEQTILRVSYVTGYIAHHILPVRHFPLFAEHPANGIALCDHCHGKVHGGRQWYGWAAIDCIHWVDRRYNDPPTNSVFMQAVAKVLDDGSYYDLIHLFGRRD